MDINLIRIVGALLAVILVAVIVVRRRKRVE